MSEGTRTPYEVLATELGLATRSLVGNANADYQTLRAACALVRGRVQMSFLVGDMLRAACTKYGGRMYAENVSPAQEQEKTCIFRHKNDWRGWCWVCRVQHTVSKELQ